MSVIGDCGCSSCFWASTIVTSVGWGGVAGMFMGAVAVDLFAVSIVIFWCSRRRGI